MPAISAPLLEGQAVADPCLSHVILAAVRARCGLSVGKLTIAVRSGVVTLHARVRSFHVKQVLLHTVQRVPGVLGIVDEVEVVAPWPRYDDDGPNPH